MGVDRGDELPLELERYVPDEAHQRRAGVIVAQQQLPQGLGELVAERFLPELPDDGPHAVVEEQLPQRLWAVEQPFAQQAELFFEDFEGFAALKVRDLAPRAFEGPAGLAIT